MPLIFYLFAWLNFFMSIPRNWSGIEAQNSPDQSDSIAKPDATDNRLKAGAILAFLAWCVICYNLRHSIHFYKPRNRGPIHSFAGFFRYAPTRFLLTVPLLLLIIAYAAASAWVWEINIGNQNVSSGWLYGLGYSPVILILAIYEIDGIVQPNEDRALIRQRIEHGLAVDAELGLDRRARKPWWWKQSTAPPGRSPEARLKNMTAEIGGGRATTRGIERGVEMGNMPPTIGRGPDPEAADTDDPFQDGEEGVEGEHGRLMRPPLGSRYSDVSERTMVNAESRPQQVRSMLDV